MFFRRRQKQHSNEHAMPGDIVLRMERFGQFEFNPQANKYDDATDIGELMAALFSFAEADPDGFLVALAEAVLPVGGWAVYGANRTIWECFSSKEIFRLHPAANAIMSAAIEFLRANRVSPMNVRAYEWEYWLANGGTRETWLPRLPTPSQVASNPANIPDSPEAWVEASIAHIQNARYAEAVAACDQAIQLNPAYAPAYASKGAALTELDRYTEALAAYDRALQLDPANAEFYAGKGLVLAWLNRFDEALAAYDRALQLDPHNVRAYTNKADVLADLKRYDEAVAAYDRVIQLAPTNVWTYAGKGLALYYLERYEEALAAYDRALQLDPSNALLYTNKSQVLSLLHRYEEALAAYNRVLQLNPADAGVYVGKGNVFIQLNRYEEALALCDRALQLDPSLVGAYIGKGLALSGLKRYVEALASYDRALTLVSNDTRAWSNKGVVLENLRRFKEAQKARIVKSETTLSLFAIARTILEENDMAFINKIYTVQAGVSRNKPENFEGEPFDLVLSDTTQPLSFDILLHASKNVELLEGWQKRLHYNSGNLAAQNVEFPFKVVTLGPTSLDINFYHERHWLRTVHFGFAAIEQAQPISINPED